MEFSAAHRLHNDSFDSAWNASVFGRCANPNGHGHNYRLEVTVEGEADERTGMIPGGRGLAALLRRQVIDGFGERHLNHDVAALAGSIPTAENIVVALWKELAPVLPGLARLRLHESQRNSVTYEGSRD